MMEEGLTLYWKRYISRLFTVVLSHLQSVTMQFIGSDCSYIPADNDDCKVW